LNKVKSYLKCKSYLVPPVPPAPLPQVCDITQKPRFYGVKVGRSVVIYCISCQLDTPLQVDWFRAPDSDLEAEEPVGPGNNVVMEGKTNWFNASLLFLHVTPKDSGVYYCRVNGTRGPGTGLQVIRESPWFLVPAWNPPLLLFLHLSDAFIQSD